MANLHDKTECYGLVLKKLHKIVKFNQNAWLKRYIDKNTDLRKKGKNHTSVWLFSCKFAADFQNPVF